LTKLQIYQEEIDAIFDNSGLYHVKRRMAMLNF